MHKLYSILFLLLFSTLPFFIPGQVTAQNDSPYIMKPISAEAFEVMRDFFNYDKTIPLDARIVESQDNPEYVREKVVFRGVRDSRVPGYLAIPKNGTQPYPCVLLLHGAGGSKASWWDPKIVGPYKLIKQLLLSGFAVMSLDAQYHGERILNNDFETTNSFIQRGWWYRIRDMLIQSTIKYRRGIDYLSTRSEIDINKIGVLGYSLGSMMTFQLTGVEPRIRVSVACVTPTSKRQYSASTPHYFAQGIDSRPFLMLMGRKDSYYTIDEAQQLFELVDSPTKELVFYDSGHILPDDFATKAVEWFLQHLK
jgi:dienelactone hydrolase